MHHVRHYANTFFSEYFSNKELDELYLSVFLRYLAESMISIFVPIYLMGLGYSLVQVVMYYIVYYSMTSTLFPFCMIASSKIGLKKMMALGSLGLILFYFMLSRVSMGVSIYVPAFILGFAVAFYYSGYHIEFTRASKGGNEGKKVSVMKIIIRFTAMIGPILGSLVISNQSYNLLFIFVSVVLFISIWPLFLTKDVKIKSDVSLKKILNGDSPDKAFAYQSNGALSIVSGILWPIFIFLTLKNVISLGLIVGGTSLFLMFAITYIGRLSDKSPNKTLKAGVYSNSTSWPLKILLLSPFGLFFTNFFSAIASSAIDISFAKIIYEKARHSKNIVNYFIFRELNLGVGRVFILLTALLLNNLILIFIFATLIPFGYLVITKSHSNPKMKTTKPLY